MPPSGGWIVEVSVFCAERGSSCLSVAGGDVEYRTPGYVKVNETDIALVPGECGPQ